MVIASSATIIKDKKILLIKRSNYTKVFPEHWACPGGRADEGETPEQNVIREVKEEINLEFEPKELIKKGQYKDRELYRFYGTWSGEVQIQEEEVADWNWFSYDDAIKLKLAFDYREVIEILHKKNLL
jgi:mutator protein MutT